MRLRNLLPTVGLVAVLVPALIAGGPVFAATHHPRRHTPTAAPTVHPPVTVVAHRGGMGLAPQNSAAAFDHAIRAHYPVLETDVRSTRDGVLVLWHDDTVWHQCTGGLGGQQIAALTWTQLAKVRCDRQPVLRLDTLVKRLLRPDARPTVLFAETKVRGITGALLTTAGRLGSRLILQSFDVTDLVPGHRDCLLGRDATVYPTAYATPWVSCVGVPATAATPDLVAAAHAQGRIVWVYTVDDPGQMRTLACRPEHVDGIITNRPDLATRLTC